MWIFWALLSAILVTIRRPIEKKIINELHPFTYGFLVQIVSLPILAILTVINGNLQNPLKLGVNFWAPLIFVSVSFHPLNTFLYKQAIKDGEFSKVLPILSLSPVFSMSLAWITLGEMPSSIASGGVILTVFGIYALGLKGKRLHHPLQPFRENHGSKAMLVSVLLIAIVSIFEKTAVKASNPLFYSFSNTLGAILTLSVAMRISKQRITTSLRPIINQIGLIGILQSSTYLTFLLAIASGPIGYVSALRSTNILIGSVIGILVYKEKITRPKIISLFLIITGAICITFGS